MHFSVHLRLLPLCREMSVSPVVAAPSFRAQNKALEERGCCSHATNQGAASSCLLLFITETWGLLVTAVKAD